MDNICGFVAAATWVCKENLFHRIPAAEKMKSKNSIDTGFSTMSRIAGTTRAPASLQMRAVRVVPLGYGGSLAERKLRGGR